MVKPKKAATCPHGLEVLMTLDKLVVRQQVEILEAITGFETENKYVVKNSRGDTVFHAAEHSTVGERFLTGKYREFHIQIVDKSKNEVIHLHRSRAVYLQKMEVSSPPGELIGKVREELSFSKPKFRIKGAAGGTLHIIGPRRTSGTGVEFKVLAKGRTVGKIAKQWSGFLREAFTDADCFEITFPEDLDVKLKALLLAACFLIDFMFYESSKNLRNACCLFRMFCKKRK